MSDRRYVSVALPQYRCSVCTNLLVDPVQLDKCGHVLCGTCVQGTGETSSLTTICPECRIPSPYHTDLRLKREILNTVIPCQYCTQPVTVCDIRNHLINNCDHFMTSCRLCRAEYPCKEQLSHFRGCKECNIKCPNCSLILTRKHMKAHREHYCTGLAGETHRCAICGMNVPLVKVSEHQTIHCFLNETRPLFVEGDAITIDVSNGPSGPTSLSGSASIQSRESPDELAGFFLFASDMLARQSTSVDTSTESVSSFTSRSAQLAWKNKPEIHSVWIERAKMRIAETGDVCEGQRD